MEQNLPKHVAIREWIRRKIESGEYRAGDKIPSENVLAKEFAISRQTVRQALGVLENEGVLRRIKGSGTYVSSRLEKKPQTKTVGVITTYLDEYIFPDIIKSIERVLSENGYSLTLALTHNQVETEAQVLKMMLDKNVDGLIVEGTKSALPSPNLEIYRSLVMNRIPCVFINSHYPALDFPYIEMDDEKGGELAALELIHAGHKEIGGIFKSDDLQGHRRYAGFLKTMREHQYNVIEKHVMWYVTEDINLLFGGEGDSLVLKRIEHCSGVICYNDQIAVKLIELLSRNGIRVPEDISVVGFDDSMLCTAGQAALTSVKFYGAKVGEMAARAVLSLLEHYGYIESVELCPEIVVRNSVKKQ